MYDNPRNGGHLIGRLGWDVRLDKVGTLDKAVLRIGVSRAYKDKNTGKYETDWISVTALGESAVAVKNILGKGDMVAVTYAIRTSRYKDKEGKDRDSMELQLVSFAKLSSGGTGAPQGAAPAAEPSTAAAPAATAGPEEEIPF